jgi:hypothetical protein
MRKNKRMILSNNYILNEEEVKQLCIDFECSVNELDEELNFQFECLHHDLINELKQINTNEIIAIADLGLWNGRKLGYKVLNNLEDILYTNCDYIDLYSENGNIKLKGSHHDGTNYIVFREFKDNISEEQKDNFLNKIYNGKCNNKDISRYTKSINVYFENY